jgi:hypothetical protein
MSYQFRFDAVYNNLPFLLDGVYYTLLISGLALVFSMVTGALALTPALAMAEVAAEPPGEPYQRVSDLVELPEFIPGLGVLYVDPNTLPAGPFLAYDQGGELVSTVYMIPIAELEAEADFSGLAAPGGPVDHVEVHYDAGHPGVEEPHAHVVLWHAPDGPERVAE